MFQENGEISIKCYRQAEPFNQTLPGSTKCDINSNKTADKGLLRIGYGHDRDDKTYRSPGNRVCPAKQLGLQNEANPTRGHRIFMGNSSRQLG